MADLEAFLLPGDSLPNGEGEGLEPSKIVLGPGLEEVVCGPRWSEVHAKDYRRVIISTRHGPMKNISNRYWLGRKETRYRPVKGEAVVGVIVSKQQEFYKVDIGSAQTVVLPLLAFEGATRRNRPNLKIGTLVYCKTVSTPVDVEPTVECFDSTTGKAQGFGELKGGMLVQIPDLEPDDRRLAVIGELLPFEIAIGKNGQSWIKASTALKTVVLVNALERGRDKSDREQRAIVRALSSQI